MKKIFLSLIILSAACKKEEIETTVNLNATCDFDSRKTEAVIKTTEGTVEINQSFTTILTKGEPSQRFVACNLPEGIVNGQKILFTGEQKEILPFEKWAGSPLKLTSLTLK